MNVLHPRVGVTIWGWPGLANGRERQCGAQGQDQGGSSGSWRGRRLWLVHLPERGRASEGLNNVNANCLCPCKVDRNAKLGS